MGNGAPHTLSRVDEHVPIRGRFKRTGKRSEIFLATKFGITRGTDKFVTGDPEYVKAACAKSLSRLGVDQIDLYYLHR